VEGTITTVLVLTKLREVVLNGSPSPSAAGCPQHSIGLKNVSIVVLGPSTYPKLGHLTQGPVLIAIFARRPEHSGRARYRHTPHRYSRYGL